MIEHFGFRDGISQPLYYQADMVEAAPGSDTWLPRANPAAALNLVLVNDPFASKKEEDSFGSYLVFRKLEPNVGCG
jgi:deferrochelatase/peroxidase EfeB